MGGKPCWESVRDDASLPQSSDTFFNETLEGRHCDTNWYLGNPGALGSVFGGPNFAEARQRATRQCTNAQNARSMFTQCTQMCRTLPLSATAPMHPYAPLAAPLQWQAHAPALLGFDESIDEYCSQHVRPDDPNRPWRVPTFSGLGAHAERCVRADVNILSLYGERLPYNICRNLEWQTCAAQGKLPGQGDHTIKFAKAPRELGLASSTNNRQAAWSDHTSATARRRAS